MSSINKEELITLKSLLISFNLIVKFLCNSISNMYGKSLSHLKSVSWNCFSLPKFLITVMPAMVSSTQEYTELALIASSLFVSTEDRRKYRASKTAGTKKQRYAKAIQ